MTVTQLVRKPTADLQQSTGAIALTIPIEIDGQNCEFVLGVTLVAAPQAALAKDGTSRKKMEESFLAAFAGTVRARWNGGTALKTMHLNEALAEVIEYKLKGPN